MNVKGYKLRINPIIGLFLIIAPTTVAANYYITEKFGRDPGVPKFEDFNDNGIEDKILEKRAFIYRAFWSALPTVREEVLYGTGTELNGKKLYLPKGLFEEYKK